MNGLMCKSQDDVGPALGRSADLFYCFDYQVYDRR